MNIYNYIEEKAFCEGYQAALEERLYSELSVDEELDEINPRKKKIMSASYVREMMRSRKYMNRDGKEHLRIHIKKPTPEMLQKDREIFAAARKNPDIIY